MNECGPGVFTPMPKLPRHKSQPPRAIFHFSQNDSDSSDELGSSSNMLGLISTQEMCCLTFLQTYYKGAVDAAIPLSRVAGHLATPATFPDTVKRVDTSDAVDPHHPLKW